MIIQPMPGASGGSAGVNIGDPTDVSGILKGADGKIAAAVDGTDYLTPSGAEATYLHVGETKTFSGFSKVASVTFCNKYRVQTSEGEVSNMSGRIFAVNITATSQNFGGITAQACINGLVESSASGFAASLKFCADGTTASFTNSPLISGMIRMDCQNEYIDVDFGLTTDITGARVGIDQSSIIVKITSLFR